MNLSILVLKIIVGTMFLSLATAADLDKDQTRAGSSELVNAQDHNSTRSNRGSIAEPTEAGNETWNKDVANLSGQMTRTKDCEPQNDTKPRDENCTKSEGRNPQTGKEISIAEKKGRNPQTGKEINLCSGEDCYPFP